MPDYKHIIQRAKIEKSSFLDLGNCGLEIIPDEIVSIKDYIEYINFGDAFFKDEVLQRTKNQGLSNKFDVDSKIEILQNLPHLKGLSFRSSLVSRNIIFDICRLNLEILDVSNNHLEDQDLEPVKDFDSLISLNLSENNFTSYTIKGLKKLSNISHLNVRGIKFFDDSMMNTIIDNLFELKSLKFLDISNNNIGSSGLKKLCSIKHISKLIISNNYIDDGLSHLKEFDKLLKLDISNNYINDTNAKAIAGLEHLQDLDVTDNAISDIGATAIFQINSLHRLRIGNNEVKTFKFLPKLTKLKELDISGIPLNTMRLQYLCKCSQLSHLEIEKCNITSLDIVPFEDLKNLVILNISSNKLDPRAFFKISTLKNLTFLNVSDVGLNNAGAVLLSDLPAIENLNISNNDVGDNGIESICRLIHLKSLTAQFNSISEKGFLSLMALRDLNNLNLSNNNIKKLPKDLVKRWSIDSIIFEKTDNPSEMIYLFNNAFPSIPKEVVIQGKQSLVEYLSEDLLPLNECKLIILGDGAVGKTSVMKALVTGRFDPNVKLTHGINKIAWDAIKNKSGEQVRVNLWDFGGQHIQHSLHQFFLTERVIYLLVLNPRNYQNAHFWLEQIDKLGAESTILIVFNWKDEKDKQGNYLENFYELRKKYSKLSDPILASCRTGEGMQELRSATIKAVLSSEELNIQYPEKWFRLKQRLEKEVSVEENYIEYRTYEQWCDEENYWDTTDRKNLLRILNSIGSIVFFDKPVLNQLQVLNPEWITTGAYAVLTSEITKIKHGVLDWQDIVDIFKEKKEVFSNRDITIKYSEQQFLFIIQLMLEYQLCQKNPFKDHNYLIPAAFGEQPSKDYDKLVKNGRHYRLQFESSFEMLIIHRFIAKNILNVIDTDYWHSGIYFKHYSSETYALVTTNLYSRQIDCKIAGENIRGLWEVIREDFRGIIQIYANFIFQEEVLYISNDYQAVFLPYQEMLDALKKGVKIIEYHPTYRLRNIDVLNVLELFESNKKSQLQIEKGDNVENFADSDKASLIRNKQIHDRAQENHLVEIWKFKGLCSFIASLIITSFLIICYSQRWIFSENFWNMISNGDNLKLIGIALTFVWNTFIGKIVYDRFFDPTKEKAFREHIRQVLDA